MGVRLDGFRPFRIERFMDRFEFEVPYLLCASDTESITAGELLGFEPDAVARFASLGLGYTTTSGHKALRDEASTLYAGITPDDIVVCSAGEEAIFIALQALLSRGDHVIVQHPTYQSLHEVPRMIGCDVSRWTARANRQWEPDLAELERLIRRRTRLLVVNFPNNPTGWMPGRSFLDEMILIARRHGIVILSDEMYRMLEYEPTRRLPAACEVYELGMSIGGMSKALGLPGLRLAWVAGRNRSLLRRMVEVKDYTTICASAPSEFLATIALRHRERILARTVKLTVENRSCLLRFLEDHDAWFECVPPVGGSVAFPRVRSGRAEALCEAAMAQAGVLLLPGDVFDEPEHLRIGFGRASFARGLDRLAAFLVNRSNA